MTGCAILSPYFWMRLGSKILFRRMAEQAKWLSLYWKHLIRFWHVCTMAFCAIPSVNGPMNKCIAFGEILMTGKAETWFGYCHVPHRWFIVTKHALSLLVWVVKIILCYYSCSLPGNHTAVVENQKWITLIISRCIGRGHSIEEKAENIKFSLWRARKDYWSWQNR